MKKIILIGGGIGLLVWGVLWVTQRLGDVENDLYGKKPIGGEGVAERHGIIGPDADQPSRQPTAPKPVTPSPTTPPTTPAPAATAAPPATVPSAAGVIATAQSNVVICTREVAAYDLKAPSKLIGHFKKDSSLTIGAKDAVAGMFEVSYKEANGNIIRAFCSAQDLGR